MRALSALSMDLKSSSEPKEEILKYTQASNDHKVVFIVSLDLRLRSKMSVILISLFKFNFNFSLQPIPSYTSSSAFFNPMLQIIKASTNLTSIIPTDIVTR